MTADLSALKAPTLADFEALAEAAWATLPEAFRALTGAVVLKVDDFPSDDVLGAGGGDALRPALGFLHGVGWRRTAQSRDGPHAKHGVALPPPDPRLLDRA